MLTAKQVKQVKELLEMVADQVVYSKVKNQFTIRKGYFYRMGKSAQGLAETTVNTLSKAGFNVVVVERVDHYAPFRGGESVARNSHFRVVFTVTAV